MSGELLLPLSAVCLHSSASPHTLPLWVLMSQTSCVLQERAAELEESVEQLMADLDISLQDVVSRDEEIDSLEARLAEYQVN